MAKIKRALFSVSNKSGVAELAKVLEGFDCECLSTGGTLALLEKEGVHAKDISTLTQHGAAFDGRIKTLSFEVESAILFDREKHAQEARLLGVQPIDMVVCNFYPFDQERLASQELSSVIENIDVGGPTMVRAAAKNFRHVAVITDPADYPAIIEELSTNDGELSTATHERLMRRAFNCTADYDAAIAMSMDERVGERSLRLAFFDGKALRYGENAHQRAWFFRDKAARSSLHDLRLLHGKELSYNNLLDIDNAMDCVRDSKRPSVAVVKHNVPCGLAEAETLSEALAFAWAGDPMSAFGSVVACNRPVDKATAEFFCLADSDRARRKFVEVIVAPSFEDDARALLDYSKNLRIVEVDISHEMLSGYDLRYSKGALLLQESDQQLFEDLQCVTCREVKEFDEAFFAFGLRAVRQVRSNAVVIVRKHADGSYQLLGMGAGQPNRLTSVALAVERSRETLAAECEGTDGDKEHYIAKELSKALMVSEAFFPFADSVDVAAAAGIQTILQPGGSIRDQEVISKCNEHDVAMVLTGRRHFKH